MFNGVLNYVFFTVQRLIRVTMNDQQICYPSHQIYKSIIRLAMSQKTDQLLKQFDCLLLWEGCYVLDAKNLANIIYSIIRQLHQMELRLTNQIQPQKNKYKAINRKHSFTIPSNNSKNYIFQAFIIQRQFLLPFVLDGELMQVIFLITCIIIDLINKNKMSIVQQDHSVQMKSINKLLEIAEMKDYLQEYQEDKFQRMGSTFSQISNSQRNNKFRVKNQSTALYRSQQKQKQNNYNQEQIQHEELKLNKIDFERKRFNSTFNLERKGDKDQKDMYQNYRYIKGNQLTSDLISKELKSKNGIVCFKSNKSETIRELLNQMKTQKSKNKKVILNSMIKDYNQQPINSSMLFSYNQIKEMRKYKNFIPFREDERLLIQKIGERQSIWKRKFKQSFLKRKSNVQARKIQFRSPIK